MTEREKSSPRTSSNPNAHSIASARNSRQIEQAQPRQFIVVEQPLLRIRALELAELLRRHFSAIGLQRPVHLPPDGEQGIFARAGGERGGQLFLQNAHPSLEILEVQGGRGVKQREQLLQLLTSTFDARREFCLRRLDLLGGAAEALGVASQVGAELFTREWFSGDRKGTRLNSRHCRISYAA